MVSTSTIHKSSYFSGAYKILINQGVYLLLLTLTVDIRLSKHQEIMNWALLSLKSKILDPQNRQQLVDIGGFSIAATSMFNLARIN